MFYLVMDCYLIQTLCNARLIQAIRLQAFCEASEPSINQAEVHLSSFLQKGTCGKKIHQSVKFFFLVTTGGEGTFDSLLRCRFIYFFLKHNDLCMNNEPCQFKLFYVDYKKSLAWWANSSGLVLRASCSRSQGWSPRMAASVVCFTQCPCQVRCHNRHRWISFPKCR